MCSETALAHGNTCLQQQLLVRHVIHQRHVLRESLDGSLGAKDGISAGKWQRRSKALRTFASCAGRDCRRSKLVSSLGCGAEKQAHVSAGYYKEACARKRTAQNASCACLAAVVEARRARSRVAAQRTLRA